MSILIYVLTLITRLHSQVEHHPNDLAGRHPTCLKRLNLCTKQSKLYKTHRNYAFASSRNTKRSENVRWRSIMSGCVRRQVEREVYCVVSEHSVIWSLSFVRNSNKRTWNWNVNELIKQISVQWFEILYCATIWNDWVAKLKWGFVKSQSQKVSQMNVMSLAMRHLLAKTSTKKF